MICSKCGAQNMDGVTFCGSCGAQIASQIVEPRQSVDNFRQQPYYDSQLSSSASVSSPAGPPDGGLVPPKNFMTEAIIITAVSFICCGSPISLILGIIAIIKASNVNPEFARGNFSEANKNAESAKKLTIWAAIVAVLMIVFVIIMVFVVLGLGIGTLGGLEEILKNV